MATNDSSDRPLKAAGFSRRSFALMATTVLLICAFGAWFVHSWRSSDLSKHVSPEALADYLPTDSQVVLAVDVRQMLATPIGRQHLGPFFQKILDQAERELSWLEWIEVKSVNDIDTLLISLTPGIREEPLLLARGRFDCAHFQTGPDKLQEKTLDGFRVWEHRDRFAKQPTLLAAAGDTLVVSDGPGRIQAALKQASDPQPIPVNDPVLRDLLGKVDRRQCLWLAASLCGLGPISGIDNYLLKMVLRPLLAHAESIYGGIACADDIQAELHVNAATDEAAVRLETDLKSICEAAPGAALLSRQSEWLPLLRLLGSGQIQRDGKTIVLRCRLTADQW